MAGSAGTKANFNSTRVEVEARAELENQMIVTRGLNIIGRVDILVKDTKLLQMLKKVVDKSSLDEKKKIHIDAILEARKTAIGEHYKYFPPSNKKF